MFLWLYCSNLVATCLILVAAQSVLALTATLQESLDHIIPNRSRYLDKIIAVCCGYQIAQVASGVCDSIHPCLLHLVKIILRGCTWLTLN